jgi:hypothetical protein
VNVKPDSPEKVDDRQRDWIVNQQIVHARSTSRQSARPSRRGTIISQMARS